MRKLILTLFFSATGVFMLQAQSSKVMSAMNYLDYWHKEGRIINLKKAKRSIDAASKNVKTSIAGKTWYWKGIVYQEIAKTAELADTMKEDPLTISMESYKKAVTIEDKKFKGSDKDQAYIQLDAIGALIFDDAFDKFENGQFEEAYHGFLLSRSVILYIESLGKETLNPNKENALKNASLAAGNADMFEEEMAIYRVRLEEGEDNPLLYKAMADMHIEKEETEKAKEIIAEGLVKYPNNIDLMIEELNFYLQENKLEEAIDKLEKASQLDEENAELHFVLGTAYDKIEDRESAAKAYSSVLEIDPSHYKAIFNLGALYFNQAVKLNSEMNDLGYKQQEKYEALEVERNELFRKAKPFFERALELNPEEKSVERELRRINSALSAE